LQLEPNSNFMLLLGLNEVGAVQETRINLSF